MTTTAETLGPMTNRATLSLAWRFARARYWRSLPFFVVFLVFTAISLALQKHVQPSIFVMHPDPRTYPPFPDTALVITSVLMGFVVGLVSLGLYRSIWLGLSADEFRIANLLWGARFPELWLLPVLSAVVTPLQFMAQAATRGHAMLTLLFMIFVWLLSIVLGYAYALVAREPLPAATAVRHAAGIFQRGRRRLIGLVFQAAAWALLGAVGFAVIAVPLAFVVKALHIAHPIFALIIVTVLIVAALGLFLLAVVYWTAVALLAAGSLVAGRLTPTVNGLSDVE